MTKNIKKVKIMKDQDATPFHWFLLEVLTERILGPRHEIQKPVKKKRLSKS